MAGEDYDRGLQDGWNKAVEAVMHNRDHFRALLRLPPETHEEAMKRILTAPIVPPRGDSEVEKTVNIVADGVDLYVVLPPGVTITPGH